MTADLLCKIPEVVHQELDGLPVRKKELDMLLERI